MFLKFFSEIHEISFEKKINYFFPHFSLLPLNVLFLFFMLFSVSLLFSFFFFLCNSDGGSNKRSDRDNVMQW